LKGGKLSETTKNQEQISEAQYNRKSKCIFIHNAVVGAIPAVSRVDGSVVRQQQLDNVKVTVPGGKM
jgi:hypothetical protein